MSDGIKDEWIDAAELSLLASGYTPNEDLVDCSEWSARQVAEMALVDSVPLIQKDGAAALRAAENDALTARRVVTSLRAEIATLRATQDLLLDQNTDLTRRLQGHALYAEIRALHEELDQIKGGTA